MDEEPLDGTAGVSGMVVLGARLRLSNPVLDAPSVGLFL